MDTNPARLSNPGTSRLKPTCTQYSHVVEYHLRCSVFKRVLLSTSAPAEVGPTPTPLSQRGGQQLRPLGTRGPGARAQPTQVQPRTETPQLPRHGERSRLQLRF